MQAKNQMTAESNGTLSVRDSLGRYGKGNPGKPHGAKNKMRERVKSFVETNLENLQTYFDQLEPRDKVKVLTDLLPFVISKLQSVSMTDAEGNNLEPKAHIQYEKLSPELLKELLANTTIENE
jgi:hypothetical protein